MLQLATILAAAAVCTLALPSNIAGRSADSACHLTLDPDSSHCLNATLRHLMQAALDTACAQGGSLQKAAGRALAHSLNVGHEMWPVLVMKKGEMGYAGAWNNGKYCSGSTTIDGEPVVIHTFQTDPLEFVPHCTSDIKRLLSSTLHEGTPQQQMADMTSAAMKGQLHRRDWVVIANKAQSQFYSHLGGRACNFVNYPARGITWMVLSKIKLH